MKNKTAENKTIISPIAIDLGAQNTGVFFAHYEAGSKLENIKKEGKVYRLEKDGYTLLMANRTAARHQRRGYDRRQMAKRLFKLIWEEHFGLDWDEDVQQTISFLLNRRGFSFLSEEYEAEILERFPKEAYEYLPEELRELDENEDGTYNLDSAIIEWSQDGRISEKYLAIQRQIYIEKLHDACQKWKEGKFKEGKNDSNKLSKLPQAVFDVLDIEELEQAKTGRFSYKTDEGEEKTFPYFYSDLVNLHEYIKHSGNAEGIFKKLPPLKKKGVWNFTSDGFKMETADFDNGDEVSVKTHLHHLTYALYKVNNELQSGGMYRSKYFEEVRKVLECQVHEHKFLRQFRSRLESDEFSNFGKEPLGNLIEHATDSELKRMETRARVRRIKNLVGHISNLELKPLRKYFNDGKHKERDYWCEKRLNKIFERWILHEWRINPEKDKLKAKGEKQDYASLRKEWKEYSGTVVDFWLKTKPDLTIPPYQDNNNRRPPKCQSLVLNVSYLNEKYPEWKHWLEHLSSVEYVKGYLGDYQQELLGIESGKGNRYFSDDMTGDLKRDSGRRGMDQLHARLLQFMLDRVKDSDPLKLNEIYSRAKKLRQLNEAGKRDHRDWKKAQSELEKSIDGSNLPERLKAEREYGRDDIFSEGAFLHFVCKYYKLRQRAKDGRMFIFPEYRDTDIDGKIVYKNTRRFDDKPDEKNGFKGREHLLLTYCNHKPRQKRYQLLHDLAGVFQISPELFKERLENIDGLDMDEKIDAWLKDIKAGRSSLEGVSRKAAEAQKEHGGMLKLKIGIAVANPKKEKGAGKSEINLSLLHKNAQDMAYEIGKRLFGEDTEKEDKRIEKFNSVFSFAQIYNIAFKERNGNAKTCAVCSLDNAKRMELRGGENGGAKAQRLPAIETRIIDGGAMRLARIVGGAIAKDEWGKIEGELNAGKRVHVPIVMESNRFQFEPDLKVLKKKLLNKKDEAKQKKNPLQDKSERIEAAGKGICPYTGEIISGKGEEDHIIPRTSQWGTLNDEANLILASHKGNNDIKGDNPSFQLSKLRPNYKEAIFGTKNDDKIRDWIVKTIWDEKDPDTGEYTYEYDGFKFGKYLNFVNLGEDEQKAFRHALFLVGHPLRKKVIDAIDNRIRSLVNGTQRYFAQEIANNLHRRAKRAGKHNQLSFDYFGVEAWDNSRGNGVKDLRKELVTHYRTDLEKFDKPERSSESQRAYSHLLDAMIAFSMALFAHQKEGSFKLDLQEKGLWSRIDIETGEVEQDKVGKTYDEGLFNAIEVHADKFIYEELKRRYPVPTDTAKEVPHRPLFNENPVAIHFLKLIEINFKGEGNPIYLKGFLSMSGLRKCLEEGCNLENYEYAKIIKTRSEVKKMKDLYMDRFKIEGKQGIGSTMLQDYGSRQATVKIYSLDKKAVYGFLMDNFNSLSPTSSTDKDFPSFLDTLSKLCYFTKRASVIKQGNNGFVFNKQKPEKFKCCELVNPQMEFAWKDLESNIDESGDVRQQVRSYFLEKEGKPKHSHDHKRVRKVFSLPIGSQKGFLIKKKAWTRKNVFYCRPASNDFSQTVLCRSEGGGISVEKGNERLSMVYRGRNIFYIPDNHKDLEQRLGAIPDNAIDPNEYYEAEIPERFQSYIGKIENKRTDEKRPQFIFFLNTDRRMDFMKFRDFILAYPFRKLQDSEAKAKKKYFGDTEVPGSLRGPESLDSSIKEVEGMKKQPKNLLPALKEFRKIWGESQEAKKLEYQAKHKFTIVIPKNE